MDGLEKESKHFNVLKNNLPIGCARVRFIKNKVKLERIIIEKKHRAKQYGKLLVQHLINYAKRHNPKEIYLNGQTRLIEFYTKCGFKHIPKEFMDGGMPHYLFYMKPKN